MDRLPPELWIVIADYCDGHSWRGPVNRKGWPKYEITLYKDEWRTLTLSYRAYVGFLDTCFISHFDPYETEDEWEANVYSVDAVEKLKRLFLC